VTLRAVVGFGSNLGDRLATMRAALAELARVARVEATSRVYESPALVWCSSGTPDGARPRSPARVSHPSGVRTQGPPQGDYLNAAALVTWEGEPEALLDALLGIEAKLGRVRRETWGPRTIDLDVLWIEGREVHTPRLTVPHPELAKRAFAVAPLLDVAPAAPYAVPPGELRELETAGRL
jgi:2-amino-4-hydroxy-6-hydroxymethyldihydropteridine diphosphokinase